MNILAVVAARNESLHIRRCITGLNNEGFEVVLIDHESSDGTRETAESLIGNGVQTIIDLKWNGHFCLKEQLAAKQRIINKSLHDWVAHFDADELPLAPIRFRDLKEMATNAEKGGFNVINFLEFVFIPRPGMSHAIEGYEKQMKSYYFFEPSYPRLQRMWKRSCPLSNILGGGHRLSGTELNQFPIDGNLRHYIALSEEHAVQKYVGRRFSKSDLDRGWHSNRITITEEKIRQYFRSESTIESSLQELESPLSRTHSTNNPFRLHFWDW
jgi:hypothetical protein